MLFRYQWAETPATVDEVNPNKFIQKIIARRIADNAEFILESWELPVTMNWIAGVPVFNYSSNRVFQIPTTEIRKPITIEVINVGSGNNQFKISYPFMMRWEYWVQLLNVNTDFYDPAEPNNGYNNDWEHYQNIS